MGILDEYDEKQRRLALALGAMPAPLVQEILTWLTGSAKHLDFVLEKYAQEIREAVARAETAA